MEQTKMPGLSRRLLAVLMSVCLAVSLCPSVSWASELSAGSASDGLQVGGSGQSPATTMDGSSKAGNWTYRYTVSDGEATITGYEHSGSSVEVLSIPGSIDGAAVTVIGESAFLDCKNVSEVVLPDSVERVEAYAFRNTSATSIAVGSGFKYAKAFAFANNNSLKTFTFADGAHPEFFGKNAFASNPLLVSLAIPGMKGSQYMGDWYNGFRIAPFCFADCSAMESITFLAGGDDDGASYYNRDGGNDAYDVFQGTSSEFYVVSYLKLSSSGGYSAQNRDAYYAVNYYKSESAAKADKSRSQPDAQILVKKGADLVSMVSGNLPDGDYYKGSNKAPTLASLGITDPNLTWGVSDNALVAFNSTLSTALNVYPVDKRDMSYTYVTSPQTEAYGTVVTGGSNQTLDSTRPNNQFFRLRADSTVDLSGINVRYADGSVADPELYSLGYCRVLSTFGGGTYEPLGSGSDVNAAGSYYAYAEGKGAYSAKMSSWLTFKVRRYDATVTDATSGAASKMAGKVTYSVSSLVSNPKFVTVAPTTSWQECLIATACAGMGGGLAVFVDAATSSDEPFQTIVTANADYLVFVGDTSEMGLQSISRAKALVKDGSGMYSYWADSDAATLAETAYANLKRVGSRASVPYAWGDTAVVVSGSACGTTLGIAQYAYQAKAPVFFTKADGSLSDATVAALKDFSKVVVAGSADAVSDAVVAQIAGATGAAPTRVMTAGDSFSASLELADLLKADFSDTENAVAIANPGNPACVMAAAQYAALHGGVTFTSASSVESKALQGHLSESADPFAIDYACVAGDYSVVDPKVVDRLRSTWSTPLSTSFAVGDTFADGGLVYKTSSSSTVQLVGVSDAAKTVASPTSATYASRSYTLKSLDASAFANQTKLKSVTLPAAITSLPAGAFSGCSGLATVKAPGVTSVGQSAFAGCTALASPTFSSNLKTIGQSAFSGCAKLSQFKVGSKVTSIGASAFSGCVKLAKLTVGSKVTSIGASAFSGCAKLASVKLPASVKSLGKNAYSGCTALKSFTVGSGVKKIGASAFNGCKKLSKLTVASAKLTKSGVKNSLKGSSVKTVKLSTASAKKKRSAYKGYFAKGNSGKSVTVK